MNRLNPYLKAIVSLIGPGYAAYSIGAQHHHGQNWPIVAVAGVSSLLVWLVPNLPRIGKQIAADEAKVQPPATGTGGAS